MLEHFDIKNVTYGFGLLHEYRWYLSAGRNITDSLTSVLAVASYFFSSVEEILALIFLSKRDVL